MDKISQQDRSRMMSRVKAKGTKTELEVRRLVHSLGYRYRLHVEDLPGKPDLVFRSRKKIIFVHGCFWHRHDCSLGRQVPKSRKKFWIPKLERNAERDEEVRVRLECLGWKVMVVWGCDLKDREGLTSALKAFLD